MSDYDHRKRGRTERRYDSDDDDDDYAKHHASSHPRRRSRSRSQSPDDDHNDGRNKKKKLLEMERAARMARLRAENDEEEAKLAEAIEKKKEPAAPSAKETIVEVNEAELAGLDEEEQMKRLLGFTGGFGSTKNQKVEDNHNSSAAGVAAKNKARKYRQYMNRKNGFNRPLDKMD